MTHVKRRKYTKEDIAQIYLNLVTGNQNIKGLAKNLNRTKAAVVLTRRILEKVLVSQNEEEAKQLLHAGHIGKHLTDMFLKLRTQSLDQHHLVKPTTTDRFTKLEMAYQTFQNSLSEFIESEVALRSEQKLKLQAEGYENQIAELKEVVRAAKGDNWVNALREKFNTAN